MKSRLTGLTAPNTDGSMEMADQLGALKGTPAHTFGEMNMRVRAAFLREKEMLWKYQWAPSLDKLMFIKLLFGML